MTRQMLNALVLTECREWLGTPYRHQTSLKQVGCDCLGLLRGIWRKIYDCEPQATPDYTSDWGEADGIEHLLMAANRHLNPIDDYTPGNVILFRWRVGRPAKHIGIFSHNASFIHSYEPVGVVETTLGQHWQKKIAGCFEFPLSTETSI